MSESEEVVCCGLIEEVASKFDLPFERPFLVGSLDFEVGGWALRLLKLTPAGNISKKGGAFIFLNFCLFCGATLREPNGRRKR